jgi:hypothetical protein
MRLWLAIRVFWAVLLDSSIANRVSDVLASPAVAPAKVEPNQTLSRGSQPATVIEPKRTPSAPSSVRSDAISLLSALQREARLLDLVQEPLGNYTDAQIGAAARSVLRDSAVVLERLFALRPGTTQEDGSEIEVPRGYDPLQYKLVGQVSGDPPFHGKLAHHGWTASRCELPAWSGSARAAQIVAPIEVEVI